MEQIEPLGLDKWLALTKLNAEQVAGLLSRILKDKYFTIATHTAYPGGTLDIITSQALDDAEAPVIVEHEADGSTKIAFTSSLLKEYEFITKLTEDAPDHEWANTHFFFSSAGQVKISFRPRKGGDKIYIVLAPERGKVSRRSRQQTTS